MNKLKKEWNTRKIVFIGRNKLHTIFLEKDKTYHMDILTKLV